MAQPDTELSGTSQTSIPGERLVDMLYRNIRDYVMFSSDPAAQGRLYPHELCQRFHATATPVREALARLAAEGFIENTPRRGFHVRRPSAVQVTDLWQVRGGLEVMGGELAIARLLNGSLDVTALDSLTDSLGRISATADAIDGREHIARNRDFHSRIVELSGNQLLVTLYHGIQVQLMGAWVRRGLDTWRSRINAEQQDHDEILASLRAMDAARYAAAARQHVNTSLANALNDLQANLQDDSSTPVEPNLSTSTSVR
jgi:DNA-binding GntR family transcriptional regulator